MGLTNLWWIMLFGVSADGEVTQLAFLRAPETVQTYEDCQAVIPTLSVALSRRGGLGACFQVPEGVDAATLLGAMADVRQPIPPGP